MEAKNPPQGHTDSALAESRRLRVEMLRTAEELKGFADDLMKAARALQTEAKKKISPPAPGSAEDAGA